MKRRATAVWNGTGKDGNGNLTTQSTVLNKTQYSFNSRFSEGNGTNPEELIAAAHAGCFTMKLSFVLGEAGYAPQELITDCTIVFENGIISESQLMLKAKIQGIDNGKFEECVKDAELNCPISKLLKTKITVSASLA
jgi:osmotically inducible protein OsmC